MNMAARMIMIVTVLFVGWPARALTDRDLVLTDSDIAAIGGSRINERYAVSMQAYTLYDMFAQKTLAQAVPPVTAQSYVTVLEGGVKSSVYYYRFRDRGDASKALQFVRPFVWGGDRPSAHHPERIYHFDNYLVVVSSTARNRVDERIADKVVCIPVPGSLLQTLRERMKCAREDFDSPCGVLASLGTDRPLPIVSGGPWFGKSWEIGKNGQIEKTFYEMLQIKNEGRGMRALWMPVRPDNEGERAQMEAIIARQKSGGPANPSGDLTTYLEGMYLKNAVPVKSYGDNRAFLSTKKNTAQLVRVQKGYVLIVATEHWTGRPERIILAYFWNQTR